MEVEMEQEDGEVIERRVQERESRRPDWYEGAPFRFENRLGEHWAARIREEGTEVFVDVTGIDVDYEVRSLRFGGRMPTKPWILGPEEAFFFDALFMVAKQRQHYLWGRTAEPGRSGR
jgi:hypothetical protein